MSTLNLKRTLLSALLAAGLAPLAQTAHADERESLEQVRQTTLNLIEALVDQGVLTRAKADALIAQARDKAAATVAAAKAAAPQDDGKTQRVVYVPQAVRDQIRAEIKEEVVTQARAERWGVPNTLPEWIDRIKVDGDVRLRYASDRLGKGNPDPVDYVAGGIIGLTRAADLSRFNSSLAPTGNTRDGVDNWRVRARLGITAQVTDTVTAGLRLATGSQTNRVSTNQTLGQNFNKYQFSVDRAFVKLQPVEWFSVSGGRIPNPWFSTDLVWDEDLNFEGLALSAKWPAARDAGFVPFATLGSFPLREDGHTANGRWLHGAQVGFQWDAAPRSRFKLGLAQYVYTNIAGRRDNDYELNVGPGATYGQYAYSDGLRQRGNTLFRTNAQAQLDSGDDGYYTSTNWGLASKFRPLAITAAAEFSQFDPFRVLVSAEYVRNMAYDRKEIARRTGWAVDDGSREGWLLKTTVGSPEVRERGDWQASIAYRYLGSDAVLDAFTDSDFGLGGTNNKGYILGLTYGLERNTTLGVRWLSADSIDSPTFFPGDKFSVDTLQVDLNVRF